MNRTHILSRAFYVLIGLLLLVAGFATLLATTDWGQQVVTQQVNSFLASKIKAPFRIGQIRYKIPKSITLEDVFFQTPAGDTLLIGQRMQVELDMWGLLNNRVAIRDIDLEHIRLNLSRTLPDTAYSFQYLLNAFASNEPPKPIDPSVKPLAISLVGVTLRDAQIRYADDVAGVKLTAYVAGLRTEFDKIDVAKASYHLKNSRITGLTLTARTYAGIPVPIKPTLPGDTLDIGLGAWKLDDTHWDIRAETAGMATKGSVKEIRMESDYLHLAGGKIGLRSLSIEQADMSAMLLKANKKANAAPQAPTQTDPNGGWRVVLSQVKLINNRIRFDNQNAPVQPKGLDSGHLDLRGLSLTGQSLRYAPDGLSGRFRNGKVREKSGLNVEQLAGDMLFTNRLTSARNLLFQTALPNGEVGTLLRNQVVVRYDSVGQLGRLADPSVAGRTAAARVRFGIDLRQCRLAVYDVLLLAPFAAQIPPFTTIKTGVIRASVRANGTMAALDVPVFEVDVLTGTRIRANGRFTNLTDPNRLGADLTVTEMTTNRVDITQLAPPGTLPNTIDLPPSLRVAGRFRGRLNDLAVQAQAQSDWGSAGFSGKLAGFVAGHGQTYVGMANLTDFDAGKWLKNPKQLGPISGRVNVNGTGLDPNTLRTSFRLDVDEARVNGYRYQQLNANGQLANGILTLNGNSADPNARLTLNTRVNLNPAGRSASGQQTTFPAVSGQVSLQRLDLQKLGFYADPLELKGNLNLALTSTDPARPEGSVRVLGAVLRLHGQNYPIDSLFLSARTRQGHRSVTVQAPSAQVQFDGQFDYTKLYDIVAGEVSRYVTIPDLKYTKIPPPYGFQIRATFYQTPLLQAFVPALTRLDTLRMAGYFDTTQDTTLALTLTGGTIVYDTSTVNQPNLTLRGMANQLFVRGQIGSAEAAGYSLGLTTLTGTAANNKFDFRMMSKDSVNRDRFGMVGQVRTVGSAYQLRLAQTGLLTNYTAWQADTSGYMQYGPTGILANNFTIGTDFGQPNAQTITISSTETYANSPIRITTHRVSLGFLSKMAGQDTTLASGQLNGTVVLRDYATGTPVGSKLSFFGSFFVDSLLVMRQPIGNIACQFTNADAGKVGVNVELAGPDNSATLAGFYNPKNTKQALDFQVNLKRLDARTIEAFSFGELRRAKGKLTGQFSLAGAVAEPKIDGSMAFDSVAFNVRQLNATYRIDQELIRFNAPTLRFDNFAVRDSLNNTLTTSGTVTLTNLPNAAYDLRVSATGFQVLNATRRDNDYAYGKARVSAKVHIQGSGTSLSILGDVKLEDNSQITLVLPDQAATVNSARDVVTFINHKDTLAVANYLIRTKPDSLRRPSLAKLANANISLNVEATDKSELTIVLDELNGDNLRARGNARFNVGLDAAGNLTVLGRYDITEGVYALTYEILKRQFQLQPGGSITFSGDPLKADIDITAVYKTSALPGPLINNESSGTTTNQKLPFNVELNISGNLAAPALKFDITQPKSTDLFGERSGTQQLVEQKLIVNRQDQAEMNKQVFGLLLLNSFVPSNISDAFSSGLGGSAESLARSSVSQILSQQLERFASNLLKGVNVNFNLQSSGANASTGSASRTDLNVGLSKSFLNGRLSVSVGRNFALENSTTVSRNPADVFDNISLNYTLSRDGRYALRAYRRNNAQSDQAIVDGYITETGVGFVITIDYNTLQELISKQ